MPSTPRKHVQSIETYRGFVYPWAMDHVGHMNVQFYTVRFDEATWHFFARLGLSPSVLKRDNRALVAADQRTQYKREVVAGSLLHITTELVDIGRKSVHFTHRMYDSETNVEVAETQLVGVFFDTDRRSSVELPDSMREKAEALRESESGGHVAPGARAHSYCDLGLRLGEDAHVQRVGEAAANPGRALDPDAPSMCFDDALGDSEPQTDAAIVAARRLPHAAEHILELLSRNAGPVSTTQAQSKLPRRAHPVAGIDAVIVPLFPLLSPRLR